jgi:Putative beta-lactamase-inhibitor-like, PepSY-like
MKKTMFFLALAGPLSMLAQKAPTSVKTAFQSRFPTVKEVSYDKEKNGEYEANFKIKGIKMSANFTETGDWRETESEITTQTLPDVITKAIGVKYPKAKIVGAAKIETPENGTRYEADLKTGLKKTEVLLDELGNFIQ